MYVVHLFSIFFTHVSLNQNPPPKSALFPFYMHTQFYSPSNSSYNTKFHFPLILSSSSSTMDSQNIKHRTKDPNTIKNIDMRTYSRRDKRMAMAKRGIKSLAIAVAFPLSLTLFNIYFFGSSNGYGVVSIKPFWFPPMWALHFTCLTSSFLMGLSAWLVWAEGGFHKKPAAFSLYLAQLGLGLIWDPIVFRMGATWVGLVVCFAMFGALVGCSRQFKEVNPIASDMVKPCLAWAAFLAIVNLKLVFL